MVNRRLPMPGEKPSSVWRPRRQRPRPEWGRLRRVFLRLVLAVIVLAALGIGLALWRHSATPVTLIVNGQPRSVRTHRKTVEGVLRTKGIRPDETLFVNPPVDTPLADEMVITLAAMRPVLVQADGDVLTVDTPLTDPPAIVAAAGISLGPDDTLEVVRAVAPNAAEIAENPALATIPTLPREIRVLRARTVIVHDTSGGETHAVSFTTTAQTVIEALNAAGYTIYAADRVSPPLISPIEPGIEITLERATPVTVQTGQQIRGYRTQQTTVGGLLTELNLVVGEDDYTIPAPDTPLTPEMTITLIRTGESIRIEEIDLPYETVYIPDPNLELDQRRVVQPGQTGILERRIRQRTEDGIIVSESTAGEQTRVRPLAEVVAYGTKIVIREVDTYHGTLRYWRHMRMLATSYSPLTAGSKQPGDPRFGLSATGAEVVRGIVAVDPRVVNMGQRLYAIGYGHGVALDIGGAVKGLRIDLGYDDANLVLWNDWIDVYLLLPVPPPAEINYLLPE